MPSTRRHKSHVLERPVRCDECANSTRGGRCRLVPLYEAPGVKALGCLYFDRRDGKDGRRGA